MSGYLSWSLWQRCLVNHCNNIMDVRETLLAETSCKGTIIINIAAHRCGFFCLAPKDAKASVSAVTPHLTCVSQGEACFPWRMFAERGQDVHAERIRVNATELSTRPNFNQDPLDSHPPTAVGSETFPVSATSAPLGVDANGRRHEDQGSFRHRKIHRLVLRQSKRVRPPAPVISVPVLWSSTSWDNVLASIGAFAHCEETGKDDGPSTSSRYLTKHGDSRLD